MVLEGLGLPIFGRCDQFPNETLDLLVPLVMLDTVHQQGTANHLHVLFIQMPLESPVGQDVLPSAPAESGNTEGVGESKGRACPQHCRTNRSQGSFSSSAWCIHYLEGFVLKGLGRLRAVAYEMSLRWPGH